MIATKPAELRMNLKDYLQKAHDGEVVIVSRPRNENTIIISEEKYNRLMQERRLMAYYLKMKESGKMTKNEDKAYLDMMLELFSHREKNGEKKYNRKSGTLSKHLVWIADDFDDDFTEGFEDYI